MQSIAVQLSDMKGEQEACLGRETEGREHQRISARELHSQTGKNDNKLFANRRYQQACKDCMT